MYTCIRSGIISTGVILIHPIRVGDGGGAYRGNANYSEDSIVSSSSLLYWRRTTKQTKEEILQRCVVCVKNKRVPEGSRERNIHYANAMDAMFQTFGSANHFLPKNSEEESESNNYTDIQYKYVEILSKIQLLEASIMAYDMKDPFIVPMVVDDYAGAVNDCWGNHAGTGIYLLSHWSKVSLRVVALFQRDSYENFKDDENSVSCEWTKELFINSSYPALIKRV